MSELILLSPYRLPTQSTQMLANDDVASFLKFVVNPRDEVAFKRMVRLLPGIGPRSEETLWTEVQSVYPQISQINADYFCRLRRLQIPRSRKSSSALIGEICG